MSTFKRQSVFVLTRNQQKKLMARCQLIKSLAKENYFLSVNFMAAGYKPKQNKPRRVCLSIDNVIS